VDEQTIKLIADEIKPLLVGSLPGKLFQLTPLSLAIDFRLHESRYLLISLEPAQSRVHLIERRLRDLEKSSLSLSPFALQLKKELSGLPLSSIDKDPGDRIVRFVFAGRDDLGAPRTRILVAQLTGRASNLFLLNEDRIILGLLRPSRSQGQRPGATYLPPAAGKAPAGDRDRGPLVRESSDGEALRLFRSGKFSSLSAALDAQHGALAIQQAFDAKARAAQAKLQKDLTRAERLLQRLQDDLAGHADADQQKRVGDLLLANLSTAKRHGSRVKLIDYFADGLPSIEIDVDENSTLQEEATRRFASYSRSKRAVEQIKGRIGRVKTELGDIRARQEQLNKVTERRDEAALSDFTSERSVPPPVVRGSSKGKPEKKIPGTRRYLSSDGYEILVGRAARDNDYLTFKVARPNDLWLHSADYPGSHVVVRNSTRKEVPHRTIIEASQLAAYFSDARKDAKVTVRYTPRKFLSKPKGAAPGLVRLSRFKSITVEPRETPERVL
jgi:predicted ribosome quality control (RQC) complex YloA/Tae2 family protein